jgi:hypothetical protein
MMRQPEAGEVPDPNWKPFVELPLEFYLGHLPKNPEQSEADEPKRE